MFRYSSKCNLLIANRTQYFLREVWSMQTKDASSADPAMAAVKEPAVPSSSPSLTVPNLLRKLKQLRDQSVLLSQTCLSSDSAVATSLKFASPVSVHSCPPRLVAVSKYQSTPAIVGLYEQGQRRFGENYVQELIDKASQLPSNICWHFIGHLQSNKCGQLVSSVRNLHVVESLDSCKLANKLQRACEENGRILQTDNIHDQEGDTQLREQGNRQTIDKRQDEEYQSSGVTESSTVVRPGDPRMLEVMVQVNVTGEETKSGIRLKTLDGGVGGTNQEKQTVFVFASEQTEEEGGAARSVYLEYSEVLELVRHVILKCPNLIFRGFMTIGDPSGTEQTEVAFRKLSALRDNITRDLKRQDLLVKCKPIIPQIDIEGAIEKEPTATRAADNGDEEAMKNKNDVYLEMSMGMSQDLAVAIRCGTTEVRVGTALFGARQAKKK
eukprot:GHVQ01004030.1.p1 GENE.GHVQ01004030.1~~GHVQ01004030.1.p1  ORF type:complete len:439 (-),score=52.97 GHVQ01004030.1:368-1684(-)